MHAICNHLQQIKVAVTTPCNGICSIQLRYLCPLCRCCDGHHYPNSIAVVFTVAWIVITNKIDGCVLGMWDMGACSGEWNWSETAEGMMGLIGLA
ncbi:hypothetical protein PVAP13_6NG159900 [Panicum virgatum]|uniref:Uncharacterized protein n=1 Tax=Panicum virgatum TaxID=38727 RepID=A0A8T0QYS0_PANVG|nr:hypothetical protein PVAP13_6NG159900 [Panicum virgatum]